MADAAVSYLKTGPYQEGNKENHITLAANAVGALRDSGLRLGQCSSGTTSLDFQPTATSFGKSPVPRSPHSLHNVPANTSHKTEDPSESRVGRRSTLGQDVEIGGPDSKFPSPKRSLSSPPGTPLAPPKTSPNAKAQRIGRSGSTPQSRPARKNGPLQQKTDQKAKATPAISALGTRNTTNSGTKSNTNNDNSNNTKKDNDNSNTGKSSSSTSQSNKPSSSTGTTNSGSRSLAAEKGTGRTPLTSSPPKRKRPNPQDDLNDNDDDDDDAPPAKKRSKPSKSGGSANNSAAANSKRPDVKARGHGLACPFYRHDPIGSRECREFLLTKISYVKQHITRHHRRPAFCPLCMDEFDDEDDLQDHVRAQNCSKKEYMKPRGVTEDQLKKLRGRVDQKKNVEEQWYDIYKILFPDAPRPRSVYVDHDISPDVGDYVGYMLHQFNEKVPELLLKESEGGNHPPPFHAASSSAAPGSHYIFSAGPSQPRLAGTVTVDMGRFSDALKQETRRMYNEWCQKKKSEAESARRSKKAKRRAKKRGVRRRRGTAADDESAATSTDSDDEIDNYSYEEQWPIASYGDSDEGSQPSSSHRGIVGQQQLPATPHSYQMQFPKPSHRGSISEGWPSDAHHMSSGSHSGLLPPPTFAPSPGPHGMARPESSSSSSLLMRRASLASAATAMGGLMASPAPSVAASVTAVSPNGPVMGPRVTSPSESGSGQMTIGSILAPSTEQP